MRPKKKNVIPFWLPFIGLALVAPARAQSNPDYEQPPVAYSATAPADALAALHPRIAAGELSFAGGEMRALQTLLAALGVPVESQMLVSRRRVCSAAASGRSGRARFIFPTRSMSAGCRAD